MLYVDILVYVFILVLLVVWIVYIQTLLDSDQYKVLFSVVYGGRLSDWVTGCFAPRHWGLCVRTFLFAYMLGCSCV